MSFNYKKQNGHDGQDSLWTSYSDLFMGLSFVFLLLYVTASLRAGTSGIQQQIKSQKIAMENKDLRNQLKVYDALKKDYLQTEATPEEEAQYENLMNQLDLLQDEAQAEKEKLLQASKDHAKKEVALNQYQQMVRNIVNSNAIAKARINKRNVIIDEQDEEISVQGVKIEDLEKNVAEKKRQIAARESQIESLNDNLDKRVKDLQKAYQQNKMSEQKYQAQMKATRAEHDRKVSALESQQAQAEKQLEQINSQLSQTQGELAKTEGLLGQKTGENLALQNQLQGEREEFKEKIGAVQQGFQRQLAGTQQAYEGKLAQQQQGYEGKLAEAQAGYAAQVAKLQGDAAAQRARDKAAFDAEMGKAKMGAAERAAKEAAFRAAAAQKERDLANKIAGLKGELEGTSAELAKAKAEIEARKKVAKDIKDAFAKAGIKAEVDGQSGDVTLDFGDHYFETGRADIKPEMAAILQKAIPIYSKSLLENRNVNNKIESVEIVGFASPTYKGRVIDPKSMDPEDRKAAEYNMDLSYQRARSIFQYVSDQDRMRFKHQQDVRNLIKVSGKSFFEANKVDNRNIAGESVASFCRKYDCKKSQRVLIKFNVKQN